MDKLTQAFNFRHACKVFDQTKKISDNDIDYILQAGQKSPSSFGTEPWHFLVVTSEEDKAAFSPICFNQPQIHSCSHFVIILYRKANQFTIHSEYLKNVFQRQLPPDSDATTIETACQYFLNYCNNELSKEISLDRWSEMQCYLPCANMMTAAAYIGIDSCAIGGFQYDNMVTTIEKRLPQFNKNSFGIALCIAFGYRQNSQSAQIRWSLEEITTFL